ncbi:hypothetical protein SAMN02799620_06400 [Mycolicibacterium fluoranthenivorans]|uniref:Uncharacterized protein n=1 Tax=Mycolicibacterium fluoranthenivorans TaxID=258505 RepID=A0A1G4X315_9MYCO|nr:hypothetical protein SAMN02799620_06400 [Mycolicibacterium fluoranthenivorans]
MAKIQPQCSCARPPAGVIRITAESQARNGFHTARHSALLGGSHQRPSMPTWQTRIHRRMFDGHPPRHRLGQHLPVPLGDPPRGARSWHVRDIARRTPGPGRVAPSRDRPRRPPPRPQRGVIGILARRDRCRRSGRVDPSGTDSRASATDTVDSPDRAVTTTPGTTARTRIRLRCRLADAAYEDPGSANAISGSPRPSKHKWRRGRALRRLAHSAHILRFSDLMRQASFSRPSIS